MTMLASRTLLRLRPLQAHSTSGRVLASSGASSLRLRHPIQMRAFRFDLWPTSLDHAYHRELRRRHRILHKHVDNINRRLSWHDLDHPLADEPAIALRRVVARFWSPTVAKCSSRSVNRGEHDSRETTSSYSFYSTWRSHLEKTADPQSKPTQTGAKSQRHMENKSKDRRGNDNSKIPERRGAIQSEANYTTEKDYTIDPITNRKVQKQGNGFVEIGSNPPKQACEAYESQSAPSAPPNPEVERSSVHLDDKPPVSELRKYAQSDFDDWAADYAQSSTDGVTSSAEKAALKNEEYALNHLPLDDPIEDHDDLQENKTPTPDSSPEEISENPKSQDLVSRIGSVGPQSDFEFPTPEPISELGELQNELRNYGPYIHDETPPTTRPTQDSNDLKKYRYDASEEPKPLNEPVTAYDDLHKYEPTTFQEAKAEDQPFKQYGDLEKYKTFRFQHLDAAVVPEPDIVTESLKDYEAKAENREMPDATDTYGHGVLMKMPKMKLPEGHVFSKHYSGQIGTEAAQSTSERAREKLDKHMSEFGAMSDAIDREVNYNLQNTRRRFTKGQDVVQNVENLHSGDASSTARKEILQSTPDKTRNTAKLEPALNRRVSTMKSDHRAPAFGADLYSKEPQGLETSFAEEHGGRHTMPLYKRHYGSEPGQVASQSGRVAQGEARGLAERPLDSYYHRDPEIDGIPPSEWTDPTQSRKATRPEEPTIYKILTYDSARRTVRVTETSSVVPDLASPLSPTEVLTRLSNPTQFIPHFAHLQAEGFEITSGCGDILVFRQVRPARAVAQGGANHVNPIDLMGRSTVVPNAAAFVSPTGFVNYDMPRVEEEPTEPARPSGTRVRREEAVFSGPKRPASKDKKSQGSRMNLGGRIILGGASAAGVSYALGVVSEYFATGGTDGKGPTGF